MPAITIQVEVMFQSDYHIGSGFGYAGIVDDTVAKDGNGQLYIPGETLKGLTRYAADQLLSMSALMSISRCDGEHDNQSHPKKELCGVSVNRRNDLCILCRIFGSPFSQGNFRFSPAYYAKHYDTLTSHPKIAKDVLSLQTQPAAFNKIHRQTGRAQEDYLFSLELGTKQRPFQFKITERTPHRFSTELRRKDLIFLTSCLRMIRKVGGKRRRGKGEAIFQIDDGQNIDELGFGNEVTPNDLINQLSEVT